MNVIHSHRVLGILPYPFVFIAASRRLASNSLLKAMLSQLSLSSYVKVFYDILLIFVCFLVDDQN